MFRRWLQRPHTRRACVTGLGALGLGALSGCIGGSREPATVETTVIARFEGDEDVIIEEDREIDGGDFYAWQFFLNVDGEIEYTVEVVDGPELNVYIIDDDVLDPFQDGDAFEAIDGTIWTDIDSVTNSVELREGEYWIVVANADREPENA